MPKTEEPYKTLLTECLALRGKGGLGAFTRAVKLCRVYEDNDYRAFCAEFSEDATGYLDQYVEDLCLSFLELKTLLTTFPNREQWKDGKLRSMYAKSREESLARQKQEAVKEPRQSYKTEAAELRSELDDVRFTEKTLREQNEELRMENERLKGRIEELQRLLNRDQVAV